MEITRTIRTSRPMSEVFAFVIARRRHERHLGAIRAPLHVDPGSTADDVVAERRAVCIERQVDLGDLLLIDIDNDALEHEDLVIAR